MADAFHLDFEDPALARALQKAERYTDRRKPKREPIPVLPDSVVPIEEIRGNPTRRSYACVNLRIERTPWSEVVRLLEYDTIEQARADFLRCIASMHKPEETETMRQLTIANAEQLLRRSMAMAGATYLVDVDHPERKLPNRDQIRWHTQAGVDLNTLAALTGVKAPIQVQVTPTEEQYAMLTRALLEARGIMPEVEAEVLVLEELPAEPPED
jgi:hypothetical protein